MLKERLLWSQIEQEHSQMSILSKRVSKFSTVPIKIPMTFLHKLKKNLKLIRKLKRLRINKIILKKSRVEG